MNVEIIDVYVHSSMIWCTYCQAYTLKVRLTTETEKSNAVKVLDNSADGLKPICHASECLNLKIECCRTRRQPPAAVQR